MESAPARIKLLFVGGARAGKTSLVSRFMNKPFPEIYSETKEAIVHTVQAMHAGKPVLIEYWDVGAAAWENTAESAMEAVVAGSDAVLGVFDCAELESLAELDEQMQKLRLWIPADTPHVILAHKADLRRKCVDAHALNSFVNARNALGGKFDWCWTVGHPRFGDYDSRRGMGRRQLTAVDLINSLVKDIIAWRAEHEVGGDVDALDALWVKPFPDYQWRNAVLFDDVVQLAELEEIVFDAASPCDTSSIPELPTELLNEFNGWYAGVMTREATDDLLRSQPIGAFLIRRSEANFQLRLCFAADDSTVHHVPIKKIEGQWRIGRKDIRHIDNKSLHEVIRRLNLDEARGLQFERVIGTLSFLPKESSIDLAHAQQSMSTIQNKTDVAAE